MHANGVLLKLLKYLEGGQILRESLVTSYLSIITSC